MSRLVTDPSQCRSCGAEILWTVWPKSGKRSPVDAVPDMRDPPKGGNIVLSLHGGETGELRASMYDPTQHDAKRNRYTSHFATCPNARDHRKGAA